MTADPVKRKLVAILSADAVGYSRLMSENEEATRRVLGLQRAIIDRLIGAHEGRIFGTAGDSVLAEFPSSVEAVRCAVEVQEALQTRNESVPEKERLEFRIGVNLGDVMVDGTDILGDGVNVAARLESIAEPGGICISSSVYDQIVGKLSLGFIDLGEKSLKNITRPIRVYRLDRSGETLEASHRTRQSRKTRLAIAGALLLMLVVVGVWRAGLFERRSVPLPPPLPAREPAPGIKPPEAPSLDMQVKLQIAEAERAKAEAELARSRAYADLLKQRGASERLERKAETPLPPPKTVSVEPAKSTATIPATPPASLPPADLPNLTKTPGTPTILSVEQKGSLPSASEGVRPTLTDQAKSFSQFPVLTDSSRGIAMLSCEPFDELPAFTRAIPIRVFNGEMIVENGTPGKPGYLLANGKPAPDGSLVLNGIVIAAAKRVRGKQTSIRYEGVYREGKYELTGAHGIRKCTMTIRMDSQN